MKVLYATRLFSGLETSVINNEWRPTGVPTIFKLIEELDACHNVSFVLSAKDSGVGYCSSWGERSDQVCELKGLKNPLRVLAGTNYFFHWLPRKVAMILREIRQAFLVFREVFRFRPDVIYCDHANVFVAAILSRLQSRIPVVFRVMGIYPSMRDPLSSHRLLHKLFRWAYCSPFALVICTQDGTGVELWLEKALRSSVKSEVLLNGVDELCLPREFDTRLMAMPDKAIKILYVGKLERYKGCYEFVEGILFLLRRGVSDVHALVIGTGNEASQLKKLVHVNNCSKHFTFIDRLSHEQIVGAHHLTDLYVSMNHLGNLSNANLEAIQSDDCMIIPEPQVDFGIDSVTTEFLGDAVVNVPIKSPEKLAEALIELIDSTEKRQSMVHAIRERKNDFLWSWDERIREEMSLLEALVSDNR